MQIQLPYWISPSTGVSSWQCLYFRMKMFIEKAHLFKYVDQANRVGYNFLARHSGYRLAWTKKKEAKSARVQVPKNGTSCAETEKRRPLFVANYPPKWCTARLFHAFSTSGWVLSQFWNFAFFCRFSPSKSTRVTKNLPTLERSVRERKRKQFWNQWTKWNNL